MFFMSFSLHETEEGPIRIPPTFIKSIYESSFEVTSTSITS